MRVSALIYADKSVGWLERLVNSAEPRVRQRIAENSDLPSVLARLATDKDWEVRWAVAGNRKTSPDTLLRLAFDGNNKVRKRVAENRETSSDLLAELALDEDEEVRKVVAEGITTSRETLTKLSLDRSLEVCRHSRVT